MEIKETCKILLDKGNTQKIKCYKFFQTDIERELAIHEDVDNKNSTSITDTNTGLRLCKIPKEISKVTEQDIDLRLSEFIRHFTLEEVKKEFKRLDELKVGDKQK